MKKYLVPIDGSEKSKKALLAAKNLALSTKAEITIIYVANDLNINPYGTIEHSNLFGNTDDDPSKGFFEKLLKDNKKSAESLLEEAAELFVDFPGQVNTILERGNPAEKILNEAELDNYEMIIMGSRGLGTFSKAMLGSISEKVLNHAKTSVLIIK